MQLFGCTATISDQCCGRDKKIKNGEIKVFLKHTNSQHKTILDFFIMLYEWLITSAILSLMFSTIF